MKTRHLHRARCGVKDSAGMPRKAKLPIHATLLPKFESATLPALEAKLAAIKARKG